VSIACIVGTGLIGSSLGGAFRRFGWTVRGMDPSADAARTALELGFIDSICVDLETCIGDADAVILAGPIPAIIEILPEVDRLASPEAVIVDTGSVKGPVVAAMERLPGAVRAVGGHPLAGSHRGGPEAADTEMFHGRPFLLCPNSRTTPSTLTRASALVTSAGAAPLVLSASEHDRALAFTSHLPQLLSSLLAAQPAQRELAGPGYRDMTRLAGSDPRLWREILAANRTNVLEALSAFRRSLDDMADALQLDDSDRVERWLIRGWEGVAA
jgi:prephenate dehydrogenase